MKMGMLWLTVAITCLCVCGLSQAKKAQSLPIDGQVVDYMARPVEGAEVVVYEQAYRNGEESVIMITPAVKTDRQGRFALQAEISAQYGMFIVARKEGLALAWDCLNYSSNTREKGHFLLVLEKACAVAGVVIDHTGKAVSGVKVKALPVTSYLSRLRQRPIIAPKEWFTVETDSQGRFHCNQFAADVSCDFWVEAPQGTTYKFTTHLLSACGFEVWRSDIRLELPREGDIKGRVIEKGAERSVGGVELTIRAERDREDISNLYCARTITTDSNGRFQCFGLCEGKHKLELVAPEKETAQWVAKPVEVNVVPGGAADIQLLLEKGELVECTVREYASKRPLAGMSVSVYSQTCDARSVTDETGAVKLRVFPGEYRASAGGEGHISWRVNEPVIVKAGETARLDILLDKSPTLKGSVVDADGRPVEDVLVTVHPFGDHVYTDEEGHFVAGCDDQRTGLGTFVMARDPAHSLAALVLTKEMDKPVKLSLSPALTVNGKITNMNGIGIPAARVSLCFQFASRLSQMGAEVLTDPGGHFVFNAIPLVQVNSDYRVSVHATGFAPKTYDRISIEAEPAATTDIPPIQLLPADVSISGTVVDANGLPAARAPIFLHGAVGLDQPDKSTTTDEDGRFEIRRICRRPVRLQANFDSSPGGSGTLNAHGGDRDVKIILGQKSVHLAYASLLDKGLPELTDVAVKLSPADSEGKMLLVCFWDMQQRPSRYCLQQLSEREQQLKAQDVIVVAVQASKIDQGALDEWAKKYNVPFSVGMVRGEEEKTRFAWGVKSLPWLILTDRDHIVRAEGLALTELDDKIEAMGR